jgi:hypothetical protein
MSRRRGGDPGEQGDGMSEAREWEADEPIPTDRDARAVLGLYDLPAFARRAIELEETLGRLRFICERERRLRLEMVELRLRQWQEHSDEGGWIGILSESPEVLWRMVNETDPAWRASPERWSRRVRVARDLVNSVERFNRSWVSFVSGLRLEPFNDCIDRYNQYYPLEKECLFRSSRLATRNFVPVGRLSAEDLLQRYPKLPVPHVLALPTPGERTR